MVAQWSGPGVLWTTYYTDRVSKNGMQWQLAVYQQNRHCPAAQSLRNKAYTPHVLLLTVCWLRTKKTVINMLASPHASCQCHFHIYFLLLHCIEHSWCSGFQSQLVVVWLEARFPKLDFFFFSCHFMQPHSLYMAQVKWMRARKLWDNPKGAHHAECCHGGGQKAVQIKHSFRDADKKDDSCLRGLQYPIRVQGLGREATWSHHVGSRVASHEIPPHKYFPCLILFTAIVSWCVYCSTVMSETGLWRDPWRIAADIWANPKSSLHLMLVNMHSPNKCNIILNAPLPL